MSTRTDVAAHEAVAAPTADTWLRRSARKPEVGVALVILVLAICIAIGNPNFATGTNLFNLLRAIAITGIVAVGMTFVLIAGELDLSVGSVVALSGVTAFTVAAETSSVLAIPVGLLVGGVVGLVSGLVVTRIRVNSFIVTLGMLSVARGLSLLITGGLPVNGPPALQALGQGAVGPVPVQVIVLLVIAVLGQLVLTRTVFGNQVQAVGDNRDAARLSGIPVARIKVTCLVLVGVLAGLAGLIRGAQLGVAEPNAAVGLELQVIAAVIIGGTSLSGGRGSVTGALLGAVLLGLIQNAFVLLHLSNYLQVLSTGLIIVLAAAFDRLRVRRSRL
ncbi:ABC transporter permease [Pseudonocardia sp. MH-G8]|uniref:ABC transporter permease n=1 Tax=Pseudonocardia sp. MH-G8 TaxID=1854588 RepID=UPI000BA08641|nr:ABC transporter permease [Pseudonocardia sp. MH-G8]OZM78985.1 ATPase [Pseudonocardia sp. MH-G8]